MRPFLIAAALLAGLSACTTSTAPAFRTEAAPGFTVTQFKTYSWATTQPQQGINPFNWERIRDGFDRALAARGFQKVESGGDMIVAFTIGARDRVETTNWGPVGPYYPGWGRRSTGSWAFAYSDIDVRTVTQGSLALDVFDGKTNRPVWHGFASRDLNRNQVNPELVANAVNGLVDRFAGVAPAT